MAERDSALLSHDRYELRGLLGEGGSGRVYRALDRVLAREVALKTLKTVNAEEIYRLKKEFRTLVDVAHPHIIRLYDLVASPEQCFFTMELIEGHDILSWAWDGKRPEGGRGLDAVAIDRLKRGLLQLVQAISALHDLGRVHRDIKPSNVLVAPGDRVVLLDVGLVSRLQSRESEHSRAGSIVGTLQYMAPEQTWGREITPAADWYSVGMVLYEGVGGRLPYDGFGGRFIYDGPASTNSAPRCPSGTPEELKDLVYRLLDPVPERRPAVAEILTVLGDHPAISSRRRGARVFAGREPELARLERLYSASREGNSVFVRVSAPPGFGKTELVATFLSRKDREEDALVLRGRCHYREYVTFKALDGVVDNLTRFMAHLEPSELSELLPADAGALFHVFPVFRRIETLAHLQPVAPAVYDFRLRHRAFVALRELLRRIADRRALVLWIDDLQWADRDSALFLRSLQQSGPFASMLCLYSYRTGEPLESYLVALTSAQARGGVVQDMGVGPLSPDDVRLLVRRLAPDATEAQVRAIVEAGAGVPLLVQVLCGPLFHRTAGLDVNAMRTFDDFMAAIVLDLPAPAAALLRAICLAGYGIEHRLVVALMPDERESALARLHEAGLVRQVERERLRWEPAHDKIREAIVRQMSGAEREALNERMLRELESLSDPDPHDVLEHLLGGGHAARALERALDAAADADRRASFQLASSLYRRALDLGVVPTDRWSIQARLGHALINVGLGREGARELIRAAELRAAQAPDDPEVLRLRSVAGERLLLGGYWDDGIELVRGTMAAVGVPQAKTARGALLRGLMLMPLASAQKRRWRLRAGRHDVAPTSPTPLRDVLRLEVVWSAGLAIAWLDPMRAIELHFRHAVLAYAAGDRGHIARSKSVEAIILAMRGGRARWNAALEAQEAAQRLADLADDADVQVFVALHWGLMHYFMGRWRDGLRLSSQAIDLGYRKGVSAVPEMLLAQWICLTCHAYLGEFDEVRSRLPDCLMAVEARDEQLSISCARLGWVNFVYLCDGDLEAALADSEFGFAPFANGAFNSVHYLYLISRVNIELYRRLPEAAWTTVQAAWKGLVGSRQLAMTTVSCEMYEVRGRAALARAVADPQAATESLRELRSCCKALAASSMESAHAFAAVLLCGAATLEERGGDAVEHLERALMAFARLEMGMHAAACRWRLSAWLDGTRSHDLRAAAEAWFAQQAIREPERIADVLVPTRAVPRAGPPLLAP